MVASVTSLLTRRTPTETAPPAPNPPPGRARVWRRPTLGPLRSLAFFFAVALAIFSLSRLFLVVRYFDRLRSVAGAWWVLPIGLGIDFTTLCHVLVPAAAVMLLAPVRGHRFAVAAVAAFLAVTSSLMALLELITPSFLERYDSRPNHVLVDQLKYPGALVRLALTGREGRMVVVLAAGIGFLAWSSMRLRLAEDAAWSWRARLSALAVGVILAVVGVRASFVPHAARASVGGLAGDRFAAELTLNSTYTFAFAVYQRRRAAQPEGHALPSISGGVSR